MVTGHPPADAEHWQRIFEVSGGPDEGRLTAYDDLHCSPLVRLNICGADGNAWIELTQFQTQALGHVLLNHKRTLDAMRD